MARRIQAAGGLSRELAERSNKGFVDARKVGPVCVERGIQTGLRLSECTLELWPCAPGQPAVRRVFQHGLNQLKPVAVGVQGGVGLRRRPEQRKAIAVWHKSTAGRAKRELRASGQGNAERLPIQSPVKKPEIAGVDVDQDAAGFQRGEIERQTLNRRRGQAQLFSSRCRASVDGQEIRDPWTACIVDRIVEIVGRCCQQLIPRSQHHRMHRCRAWRTRSRVM